MAPALSDLEIELDWRPLDLSQLLARYPRGQALTENQRANARRVAQELQVDVEMPAVWPDSRAVNASVFAMPDGPRAAAWRERVFTGLFEEGRTAPAPEEVSRWAQDLGWKLAPNAIDDARNQLRLQTEDARDAMVTGVPTFMFGDWPFGGIQTEDTMRQMLARYAARQRAGATA